MRLREASGRVSLFHPGLVAGDVGRQDFEGGAVAGRQFGIAECQWRHALSPADQRRAPGQACVLSADGTPLGTVQAALNPGRAGLMRAQVSQHVGRIDLTYLGPDDLSGA